MHGLAIEKSGRIRCQIIVALNSQARLERRGEDTYHTIINISSMYDGKLSREKYKATDNALMQHQLKKSVGGLGHKSVLHICKYCKNCRIK